MVFRARTNDRKTRGGEALLVTTQMLGDPGTTNEHEIREVKELGKLVGSLEQANG